jgi:acyl carrier protein
MKKNDFYYKIQEALELDDKIVNDKSSIYLSSLQTLALIAFVDENFEKQLKIAELRDVKSISDLMSLIGMENFTE